MRLAELSNNRLVADIERLKSQARQLKNRQFASGAYNVKSYLNQTGDTWDYDLTIGDPGQQIGRFHDFGLGFDTETKFAFGTPYMDIFVDGTTEANRITIQDPIYNGANGTAKLQIYNEWLFEFFDNTHGEFGWYSRLAIFGQVNLKLKYYARSTNVGVISKDYAPL